MSSTGLLTRLADYYCALPVVSETLKGALLKSRIIGKYFRHQENLFWTCECKENSVPLLLLARKLRHEILFKQFLIQTVGRWNWVTPSEMALIEEDKELMSLIRLKIGKVWEIIAKAYRRLLPTLLQRTHDVAVRGRGMNEMFNQKIASFLNMDYASVWLFKSISCQHDGLQRSDKQ